MSQSPLLLPLAIGVFFGLLTPLLFVFLNHDTRVRHIRLILAIQRTFGRKCSKGHATKLTSIEDTPSFTMVLSKYFADLDEMEIYLPDPCTGDCCKDTNKTPERDKCIEPSKTKHNTAQSEKVKPFRKSFLQPDLITI